MRVSTTLLRVLMVGGSTAALAATIPAAGAAHASQGPVATPRVEVGLSGAGVQATTPSRPATLDVASGPPNFGVPVEVREITGNTPSPQAVLVNMGPRDIHVFELAVFRPGRNGAWEFVGSSGQSGIAGWRPGEERRSSAAGWRPDDGSVLVPTMAFFDDGTAVGRPETIEAARASARSSRIALEAVREAFDAYPDPVSADQLPTLIDRVALAFARAPYTADGRGSHQFFSALNELRRLVSPLRPANLSIEDGVAQARTRIEQALEVERRLPVLLKDSGGR